MNDDDGFEAHPETGCSLPMRRKPGEYRDVIVGHDEQGRPVIRRFYAAEGLLAA